MSMKTCVKCGTRYPVGKTSCPDCGANAKAAPADDPDRTRCAYTSEGLRCRYPGTMSPIIWNGEGQHPGPWYCGAHWQCHSHVMGDDVVQASMDYKPVVPSRQRLGGIHPDALAARRLSEQKALAEAAAYCQERGIDTKGRMQAVWQGFRRREGL